MVGNQHTGLKRVILRQMLLCYSNRVKAVVLLSTGLRERIKSTDTIKSQVRKTVNNFYTMSNTKHLPTYLSTPRDCLYNPSFHLLLEQLNPIKPYTPSATASQSSSAGCCSCPRKSPQSCCPASTFPPVRPARSPAPHINTR